MNYEKMDVGYTPQQFFTCGHATKDNLFSAFMVGNWAFCTECLTTKLPSILMNWGIGRLERKRENPHE